MARYRDNSNVKETCPMIDEVIGFLLKIEWLDNEDEQELKKESELLVNTLEEIRDCNKSLRDWGNEQYKERNEFEEQVEDLEKEIEQLKLKLNEQ